MHPVRCPFGSRPMVLIFPAAAAAHCQHFVSRVCIASMRDAGNPFSSPSKCYPQACMHATPSVQHPGCAPVHACMLPVHQPRCVHADAVMLTNLRYGCTWPPCMHVCCGTPQFYKRVLYTGNVGHYSATPADEAQVRSHQSRVSPLMSGRTQLRQSANRCVDQASRPAPAITSSHISGPRRARSSVHPGKREGQEGGSHACRSCACS